MAAYIIAERNAPTYIDGYRQGQYDLAKTITEFLANYRGFTQKELLGAITETMKEIEKEMMAC